MHRIRSAKRLKQIQKHFVTGRGHCNEEEEFSLDAQFR